MKSWKKIEKLDKDGKKKKKWTKTYKKKSWKYISYDLTKKYFIVLPDEKSYLKG